MIEKIISTKYEPKLIYIRLGGILRFKFKKYLKCFRVFAFHNTRKYIFAFKKILLI